MSKFSALQEARPAWPGFDVMLYARFEESRPRIIKEDEFLQRLSGRIHHLGRWYSPIGPARIFFVGYEDKKDTFFAVAVTTEATIATHYLLIPTPVGITSRRRLAE